jgi:hypothetical protein
MKSRLIVLIMFALAATVLESCFDEKDTIAEIRVITANDTAVPGAEVRIFGRATETSGEVGNVTIDTIAFTDTRGIAEFDFTERYKTGQSGFAILDVEITAEFPDSTVFLEGIIRVVEQETTRRTFTVE